MNSSNNLLGLPVGAPPPVRPSASLTDPSRSAGLAEGEPPRANRAQIAPFPLIDRFPTIVGSNLSLTYLSAVYRLAITGYRREYVDALTEIYERDPHVFAVVSQRWMTVAGGRLEITPRDANNRRSVKIADEVRRQVTALPDLIQSIGALTYSGMYFGVGASEIAWSKTSTGWEAKRLHFIHSRRLNYPDPGSWDMRIWDQGQLYPWQIGQNPPGAPDVDVTARLFGIRVIDYPGKFLVFTPQYRGDYPTREGLGRITGIWSALKTMGARAAAQFVERYAKPWAIATYATTSTGDPRAAEAGAGSNNDIEAANNALMALGTGSLAGAVIPDSIKIELQQVLGGKNALTPDKWVELCDRQNSKAVLGQTDTTDPSKNGSKSAVETRKTGSNQLAKYDAGLIGEVLQSGLVDWIVRLNFPGDFDKRPFIKLVVDPDPDPATVLANAQTAANMGAPVHADSVCKTAGVPLADKDDADARVLVGAVQPVHISAVQPDRFDKPDPPALPGAPGANAPPGKPGSAGKPTPKK